MDEVFDKIMKQEGQQEKPQEQAQETTQPQPQPQPQAQESQPEPQGAKPQPPDQGEPQQQAQPEEQSAFDLDSFKSRFEVDKFGFDFKSEDDIRSFFENSKTNSQKAQELESKVNEFEKLKSSLEDENRQYKEYLDQFSPEKIFGSKEEAEKYMISQQLGKGRDPGVTNRLVNSDVNSLSDLEALSLEMQYNSPSLARKDPSKLKKSLLKEAGVEQDIHGNAIDDMSFDAANPQMTDDAEINLAMKATKAKDYLTSIKGKVEKPNFFNPSEDLQNRWNEQKTKREQLTNTWNDSAKRVVDKLSDVKMDVDGEEFTFEIDSDYKNGLIDRVKESAIRRGMEPNEENIGKLAKESVDAYKYQNMDKIMKAALEKQRSKLIDEYDSKVNNTKPVNQQENPSPDVNPEQELYQKMGEAYGIKV
jgi:hypothetical protein